MRPRAKAAGAALPGTRSGWRTQRCFSSLTSATLVQKFRSCAVADASAGKPVANSRQRDLLFQGPELERAKGTQVKVCVSHSAGEDMGLCREDGVRLPGTCTWVPFLGFWDPHTGPVPGFLGPAHWSRSWVSVTSSGWPYQPQQTRPSSQMKPGAPSDEGS